MRLVHLGSELAVLSIQVNQVVCVFEGTIHLLFFSKLIQSRSCVACNDRDMSFIVEVNYWEIASENHVAEYRHVTIVLSVLCVTERAAHTSVWQVSLYYSAVKCSIIGVSLFHALHIVTAYLDCVRCETLFFNSNLWAICWSVDLGSITMLAKNASVLVGHYDDFILANKHTGSSDCIGFNSCGYWGHVSEDAIFEVSHHTFIVGNCPIQILSREMSMNTIGEQHLSILVDQLPDHDAFFCHETIAFFIWMLQILVELTNVSATKVVYNQTILHGQGSSWFACPHFIVGKQLIKIVKRRCFPSRLRGFWNQNVGGWRLVSFNSFGCCFS